MSTNSKLSRSPKRNTFQRDAFLNRQAEKGLTPENDKETKEMAEWYDSWKHRDNEKEVDPEWRNDNLEWDLRTTEWILEKVRTSDSYAQNIYAALCNNGFIKLDVIPILTEKEWSCSWRYAGGIVANMRQEGDYIDWYCSGIGGVNAEYDAKETAEEWSRRTGFVPEGRITDEIRADFQRLGWAVAPGGDWENFEQTNNS